MKRSGLLILAAVACLAACTDPAQNVEAEPCTTGTCEQAPFEFRLDEDLTFFAGGKAVGKAVLP